MGQDSAKVFRKLLSPIQLGDVTLKNRIIFLAHWTNFGNNHGYQEDGLASERLAMHYIERAKGGSLKLATISFLLSGTDDHSVLSII